MRRGWYILQASPLSFFLVVNFWFPRAFEILACVLFCAFHIFGYFAFDLSFVCHGNETHTDWKIRWVSAGYCKYVLNIYHLSLLWQRLVNKPRKMTSSGEGSGPLCDMDARWSLSFWCMLLLLLLVQRLGNMVY